MKNNGKKSKLKRSVISVIVSAVVCVAVIIALLITDVFVPVKYLCKITQKQKRRTAG